MPEKNNNTLKNFGPYKDEKSIIKKQEIGRDYRDLIGKNLDTKSHAKDSLTEYTFQAEFLASELSLSLKEMRFCKQKFFANKFVLNIKYYHLGFQKNNLFHLFNNQLDYTLANNFTESEITKSNVDRFLFNLLMVLFTEKLSYRNIDNLIKKLLDIL